MQIACLSSFIEFSGEFARFYFLTSIQVILITSYDGVMHNLKYAQFPSLFNCLQVPISDLPLQNIFRLTRGKLF